MGKREGFSELIRCAVGERTAPSDALLAAVNELAEAKLTADDVYIRSGAVCNDQLNHNDCRFTPAALGQIVALFNRAETNWHRQHDVYSANGGLPIGRAFRAALEPMPSVAGGQQVRVWWYYLKGDPEGDRCERYIAAQIWRELSIACWVRSFTADVDGKPIGYGDGKSDYYPGQVLSDGRVVVGIMDDVIELEEFSLVSKGAEIGTTIEGAEVYSTQHAVALSRGGHAKRPGPDGFAAWFNGGAAAKQGGNTR